MKFLKHILVMVALLAPTLPCTHADAYYDHGHDHDAATELCALPAAQCVCHSCDHSPVTEDVQVPQNNSGSSEIVIPPAPARTLLFVLPEIKAVSRNSLPSPAGDLAVIQTIQLLI